MASSMDTDNTDIDVDITTEAIHDCLALLPSGVIVPCHSERTYLCDNFGTASLLVKNV